MLGAPDFIDAAEESGLILLLGASILRQACQQATAWWAHRPRCADMRMSVNVSASQFADPTFVDTVAQILAHTGLDPDALWLEITETCLMADASAARRTLDRVRALGVHVAVDDFGTGYSSVARLRRLPVEALKIDRSFVRGVGRDPDDEAIVAAIVALARTLGMTVVAEGVETPAQRDRLAVLGCAMVQGYLFDHPSPAHRAWFGVTDSPGTGAGPLSLAYGAH